MDELNQVWTNLLLNSVHAMKGKGTLEIATFRVDQHVGVRITDDGSGIPEEERPRIFEPFYTTKARGEGSGLGLSIVRRIVTRHGGKIGVESRPGRTSVEVLLPLCGPGTTKETGAQDGADNAG